MANDKKGDKQMINFILHVLFLSGVILGGIIIALEIKNKREEKFYQEMAKRQEGKPTAEEVYSYEEMSDEVSPQEWGEMNDMTEDEIADLIGAYRNEEADEDYGWQEDEDRPWSL